MGNLILDMFMRMRWTGKKIKKVALYKGARQEEFLLFDQAVKAWIHLCREIRRPECWSNYCIYTFFLNGVPFAVVLTKTSWSHSAVCDVWDAFSN